MGSPWWIDSLNVDPGANYEMHCWPTIPGVDGPLAQSAARLRRLVAHFVYDGVTTPYMIGGESVTTRLGNRRGRLVHVG